MDGTTRTDYASYRTTSWCMDSRFSALLDAGKIQVDAFRHALAWDLLHQAYCGINQLNDDGLDKDQKWHIKQNVDGLVKDVWLTYVQDVKAGYLDYARRAIDRGDYIYAKDAIRIFLDDKGA